MLPFGQLYTVDGTAECGPLITEFYNDLNAFVKLDTLLFAQRENEFAILMSFDVQKLGEYLINYRVYFAEYPENEVVSPVPFIVTVKDPCDHVKNLNPLPLL